jgi:hypothetical protein
MFNRVGAIFLALWSGSVLFLAQKIKDTRLKLTDIEKAFHNPNAKVVTHDELNDLVSKIQPQQATSHPKVTLSNYHPPSEIDEESKIRYTLYQ